MKKKSGSELEAEFGFYSDTCEKCSSFPSLIKKIGELKKVQSDVNINGEKFYICLLDDVTSEIFGFARVSKKNSYCDLPDLATIGGNYLTKKYNECHKLNTYSKHVLRYHACFLLTAVSIFCAKYKITLNFSDASVGGFFCQFTNKLYGGLLSRIKGVFYKKITSFEDLVPSKQYYIDKGLLSPNYSFFSCLKESGMKYRSYMERQRVFELEKRKFFECSTTKYLESDENYEKLCAKKLAFIKLKQNSYLRELLFSLNKIDLQCLGYEKFYEKIFGCNAIYISGDSNIEPVNLMVKELHDSLMKIEGFKKNLKIKDNISELDACNKIESRCGLLLQKCVEKLCDLNNSNEGRINSAQFQKEKN